MPFIHPPQGLAFDEAPGAAFVAKASRASDSATAPSDGGQL
jgi:hypothetical protein